MSVQVKICGLTRSEDVEAAVEAGADYLGFVLCRRSPRFVDTPTLRRLLQAVPPGRHKVGVLVNPRPERLATAVTFCGLDIIQFHGDESPQAMGRYRLSTAWKAVPMQRQEDFEAAAQFPAEVVLLVDAMGPAARGGTGRRCDWELAGRLAARRPVVLAGGLRPENVAEAIRCVRPAIVDVSSGVEARPGVKDPIRLRDFIQAATAAAETAPAAAAAPVGLESEAPLAARRNP